MTASSSDDMIASYGSGYAEISDWEDALNSTWRQILEDEDGRREAAAALGIDPATFVARFPEPPFKVRTGEQGTGAVEAAILIFVGGLAGDIAKDVLKDGAKAGLKKLWRLVKRRADDKAQHGAFGPETGTGEDAGDSAQRSEPKS
jgi:hypothetical protein